MVNERARPAAPDPPHEDASRLADAGGLFYGWYVIGALFFATLLVVGTRQSFGVFVETWERDWGVSVGAISFAASLGWLLNGLSQPLFGALTDRIGGRRVVLVSLSIMGAAFIAMAFVTNVFLLAAVYGVVISGAGGGISLGPTSAIVARWFRHRRGTAMSLLASGGSVGGLLLVPFLTYLYLATSWQTAWFVAGVAAILLGVPLMWLVVRSDPADLGLLADGEARNAPPSGSGVPPTVVGEATGPLSVDRWQDSFHSAPIWQLSVAYWVCGVTTAGIAVHFVRWASDEGISPGTAALAFGLLSGVNAVGVIFVGMISDRMQRKTLLGGVYIVRACAFVMLIVLPGTVALWAFAVVGGASWLATVPLTQSLTADVYGVRQLGTLGGLINMAHQLGGALAVALFGLVFDWTGSYDGAFVASALLLIAAGVLALTIRERQVSMRYAPLAAAPASVVETAAGGQ